MTRDLNPLKMHWLEHWDLALSSWSRYLRLKPPVMCLTREEEVREGLTGSFAMIRLVDHTVIVSIAQISALGLDGYPLEVLAHEIGHHIYCPADLSDNARLLLLIRKGLLTESAHAPMISNLYSDLLINDRLQRLMNLNMAGVFRTLSRNMLAGETSWLWSLYLRIYEVMWGLETASLCPAAHAAPLLADAWLGNRIVRHYAQNWLEGAASFAMLCLPYLLKDAEARASSVLSVTLDALAAGQGGMPEGLTQRDSLEQLPPTHPVLDPALTGNPTQTSPPRESPPRSPKGGIDGQLRDPFEYGELLRGLGLSLTPQEVAMAYYREAALPHLIPFPARVRSHVSEPHPEGLEIWDPSEPLEQVDWAGTLLLSPVVVPGMTTVRRQTGVSPGPDPRREPVDLDLYVDCSGSMPNPAVSLSFTALAGAVVALSALRAGAHVKATLWSGRDDFVSTHDFVRNERELLGILTGYIGGSTQFPLHLLRQTFEDRAESARPVHILVLSDDGVDTLFGSDEKGAPVGAVARQALRRAGGGGTLLLSLARDWPSYAPLVKAAEEGWNVHRVTDWDELLAAARAFCRAHYVRSHAP